MPVSLTGVVKPEIRKLHAKQAMNTDAERKATEIRIRAERKAGQLMREMERAKPLPGTATVRS